jgi:alpha-D-xyloside xylohydrolase
MNFFTAENGKLIFENNGETLQIEAWGENSLRIRSRMMGEILDTDFALLPVNGNAEAEIKIDRDAQTAS